MQNIDVLDVICFQALVELLPRLRREGHRPLIFSQWTSMLDILEWALDVTGFRYTRLDGRSGLVSIPSRSNNTVLDSIVCKFCSKPLWSSNVRFILGCGVNV